MRVVGSQSDTALYKWGMRDIPNTKERPNRSYNCLLYFKVVVLGMVDGVEERVR